MTDESSRAEPAGSAADELAVEIRSLRHAAKLSQRDLAKKSGYTREYISMAERRGANLPSHDLIRALDDVLDAGGALLALRAKARNEQQNLRVQRQSRSPTRLDLNLGELRTGSRLGAADIDQLHRHTARLRRLDDVFGGGDTYGLYSRLVDESQRFLDEASTTVADSRRLRSLLAEQHQLAGWAAFDAGDHDCAHRHYTTSLVAAEEADDAALAGNALAFLAYQQTAADVDATTTAEAAYARASDVATPRVATLLLERKAWAHSVVGDVQGTDAALGNAREALHREDDRPEPDWVFWVDQTEVDIMAGRCWTELGRSLRAVPVLERALSTFSDTHGRDKSLYLTWLASSYLQAAEVEQAAHTLVRAYELASGIASVRPSIRVRTIARQLDRHRATPEVAEALERIAV